MKSYRRGRKEYVAHARDFFTEVLDSDPNEYLPLLMTDWT